MLSFEPSPSRIDEVVQKVIFRASFLKKKKFVLYFPKILSTLKIRYQVHFSSNTEERTMVFPSRGSVELEERGSQTRLLHISGSKRR